MFILSTHLTVSRGHTSFYCVSFYCTLYIDVFFTNQRQDPAPPKRLQLAVLLQWYGTKPTVSLRYACTFFSYQILSAAFVSSAHLFSSLIQIFQYLGKVIIS